MTCGASAAPPFCSVIAQAAFKILRGDEEGDAHHVFQGEGKEQGGALMPAPAVQRSPGDQRLFASLDDVHVLRSTNSVAPIHTTMRLDLRARSPHSDPINGTQVMESEWLYALRCDEIRHAARHRFVSISIFFSREGTWFLEKNPTSRASPATGGIILKYHIGAMLAAGAGSGGATLMAQVCETAFSCRWRSPKVGQAAHQVL